jgi:hypothetical protein
MCVGVLSCLDGYMNIMNIVLEQTEEHVNYSVTIDTGTRLFAGILVSRSRMYDWICYVLMCPPVLVLYISAAEPL